LGPTDQVVLPVVVEVTDLDLDVVGGVHDLPTIAPGDAVPTADVLVEIDITVLGPTGHIVLTVVVQVTNSKRVIHGVVLFDVVVPDRRVQTRVASRPRALDGV
jgi:hypothetical protein